MNDLIRRSDVLHLLYEIFDKYRMSTDKNTSIGKSFGTDVFEEIRNMPTAYDIDKVVEELKKAKTISVDIGYGTIINTIRNDVVLEIVKQGGVSDDVCIWLYDSSYPYYKVGCENSALPIKYGDYCPYCGKKIKVAEL